MITKKPSLIATAVGSLPHNDSKEGIDLIFECFKEMPLFPQMANVNKLEDMTSQVLQNMPGVVYDEKNDKYLTINWKDKGGRLFIGGTRKNNESALDCAIREIREETGYDDLEFIKETFKINHHYYAFNKDKYFEIESTGLFFKLNSDKRQSQELDDDEVFDVEWVTKDTILNVLHTYKEIKSINDISSAPVGYQYVLFLTIAVDGNMTTFQSHKLADKLEKDMTKLDNVYKAIIHIEPYLKETK